MGDIIHALEFFSQYMVALAVLIIACVWAVWQIASRIQLMIDPCRFFNTILINGIAKKLIK